MALACIGERPLLGSPALYQSGVTRQILHRAHCGRSRQGEAVIRFPAKNQQADFGICKQFLAGCAAPVGRNRALGFWPRMTPEGWNLTFGTPPLLAVPDSKRNFKQVTEFPQC